MNEREDAKAMWTPVCLGLAVGGEHGVVSGQEWEPFQTVGQEVEPAELPSSSLFRMELEGLEVGGRLGLGQTVIGGRTGYMELYGGSYWVGNSLGFNPNFLTFSLCDLEHITSLCLIFK